MRDNSNDGRRSFLRRALYFSGLGAAAPVAAQAQGRAGGGRGSAFLPSYARAQNYRSLKQSSHDTTGGNSDRWPIKAGATQELFNQKGPGVITHIWFTIAAPSVYHLKELVLRIWWDDNPKPSVEAPIGDFFGLNLGQYVIYQSAFLACSPGRSLNCYFAMPYRKSARMTVTNFMPERVMLNKQVLKKLRDPWRFTPETIARDHRLTVDDVRAALHYAGELVREAVVVLPPRAAI